MKLHIASSNRLIIGTSTESSGRYCIVTTQRDLINANCFAGMQPFKSCATAAEADGLHRCPGGKEERSFLNGRSSAIFFNLFFLDVHGFVSGSHACASGALKVSEVCLTCGLREGNVVIV